MNIVVLSLACWFSCNTPFHERALSFILCFQVKYVEQIELNVICGREIHPYDVKSSRIRHSHKDNFSQCCS